MTNKHSKEEAVFLAALEKPTPQERDAYIERACSGDPELLACVKELFESHDESLGPLESPPPGVEATEIRPVTEQPGDTIGPYKLLQQIGEGGMGVVYMAEQKEPVKRRVALKIIKPGMDTRQVIARFEAERQALAMMDHPNIAKVLEAGQTESGRPYFVMELVKGMPVTKFCDEQHLTPKERLELFVPICQAVQHAHQKGIIHRDLKPSNILVALYDGQPVPKIIDFGVAKATSQTLTEKTMFTQVGQVVGTLEYMAPEQAQVNQLDVDTRSDIYSLGVVLYELLTGETPFDRERLQSAAFDEMLRIIREEEPSKPSTKVSSSQSLPSIAANRRIEPAKLGSMIRGELDWIVLNAMEKDRGRRYETASKFGEDVQHYLNDEAVGACPPSAAYRFRKFTRRYQTQLATAGVLTLALLVATGSLGWAVRDRVAQKAQATRERTQRQQRAANQVSTILGEAARLVENGAWTEALSVAQRAEPILDGTEVPAEIRDSAKNMLSDLRLVQNLEDIRSMKATWTGDSFDYTGADAAYRDFFQHLGINCEAPQPNVANRILEAHPRIAVRLAVALDDWVSVQRELLDSTDDGCWRPLVTIAKALDPDAYRNRLRSLWGQTITDSVHSQLDNLVRESQHAEYSAITFHLLADTLRRAGRQADAIFVLRRGRQLHTADFWLSFALAMGLAETRRLLRSAGNR